jgi:hypothetical protein
MLPPPGMVDAQIMQKRRLTGSPFLQKVYKAGSRANTRHDATNEHTIHDCNGSRPGTTAEKSNQRKQIAYSQKKSPTTNQAHRRTKKHQNTARSHECDAKKHATTGSGLKCVEKTCFAATKSRKREGGARYNKEKISKPTRPPVRLKNPQKCWWATRAAWRAKIVRRATSAPDRQGL